MSVGIIGGADGPTAVLIAGSMNVGFWIAAGCAAVLMTACLWLHRRIKRK